MLQPITYDMKTHYFTLCLAVCLFSSFKPSEACNYVGSNLGFIKTKTEKAIAVNDINKARYLTYKAISALQNSKEQFDDCGCEYATTSIEESLTNLKLATKATSLNGTKILLKEALKNTLNALETIANHDSHNASYDSKELAMVNVIPKKEVAARKRPEEKVLHQKIDASLVNYKIALDKVVDSVNCKEARAYAEKVYNLCEQQLLRPNLSEGKKYYNLKTKEITAEALARIGTCRPLNSK